MNDSSADKTLEILKKFEKNNKRINIIFQKYSGIEIERNIGKKK